MQSHQAETPKALLEAVKFLERRNPDQFEVYFESRSATKIESKDQQVESLSVASDAGISIRVISGRKLGFSFTTSLDSPAIERAVNSAIEVARFMPEDEFIGFQNFGQNVYPDVDSFDPKGLKKQTSEKVALAKELESLCRSADKRIAAIRSASISETDYQVHLIDSHGEHIQHRSSIFSASISCKATEGDDSQMGGDFGYSHYLDQLKIGEVATRAAESAVELLGAKEAPTLNCPAVFRNDVVADLIEFVSASFSAEQIDKGRSMLAGKQGELVFSDQVTLIDDGLLPGGYGTSPFDGEGVPSARTLLVDGGFVRGTLYDGYYARKFKARPSGNAQRGIKSPPTIGFNNLYLQAGETTFTGLLDGITQGILITNLMGIHTANPVTGDFSLGASGILIENGKLTRPVRGFAVAGNVLDVFKKITDIGNDIRFFGTTGAPSIRVSEIAVGGA
jgi:PmbA protein